MVSEISPATRHLLKTLPLERPVTIVDVGANPINEAPYSALLRAGGCRVVGFEPQPSAFAELQKIKSEHEIYFPHAVGDGAEVTLRVFASSGMTSIFPPNRAGIRLIGGRKSAQVTEEIRFKTVALDDLADLPMFDLLKIDIQGAENMVFRGAKRVLRQASCVITELRYLQLYRDEPMMHGSDSLLRRFGFTVHKFLEQNTRPLLNSQLHRLRVRRVLDQHVDGDVAYVRDLSRMRGYGPAQLMGLAVLADAVLRSPTLTLVMLDELVARKLVPESLPSDYVDHLPGALRAPV